ncbi:MAG TPA: GH1 family beta-glucosidase [Gaiellaceae bacterium]|jgi:beta-glucosidase
MTQSFPSGFVWGTATSAYQIEGAAGEDGRGESIWDRFSATPGRVTGSATGAVACDHYHRYREDVRLMRDLGAGAYRFSVAWPRVLPEGCGRVNTAGLDFYDRLVDELLANGIEPFVTLYHWDLPQPLEDRGGWPVRETVDAFAEYTGVVAARLGDRVRHWITQNEPWVAAWLGYGLGHDAPGRASEADAVAAGHHLLLAHGRALEILRAALPAARIGITLDLIPMHPLTPADRDVAAAAEADAERNLWFLEPVLRGAYPRKALGRLGPHLPPGADGDLEAISRPIDFLGVNYYRRNLAWADPATGRVAFAEVEGPDVTGNGWEVYPDGLYELLLRLHEDYGAPLLYVTENGAAYPDVRGAAGIDDARRIAYLERHLAAVGRALDAGVDVGGYFVWSLLDNFEWAQGYSQRFGIVYVDFGTLERIPKASYFWYRDVVTAHRAPAAVTGGPAGSG